MSDINLNLTEQRREASGRRAYAIYLLAHGIDSPQSHALNWESLPPFERSKWIESAATVDKQTKRAHAISSSEFWNLLIERGVMLPENVSRIIVDARAGGAVEVFYQCFAANETIDSIVDTIIRLTVKLPDRLTKLGGKNE